MWKRYIVSYHFTPKIINFGQLCNVVHTARARRNNLTLKEVFLSIEIWFQTTLPPFSHLVGDFPKQVSARVRSNLWQTEDRYYRDTNRIIVSLIRCDISYRIIVTICSTIAYWGASYIRDFTVHVSNTCTLQHTAGLSIFHCTTA